MVGGECRGLQRSAGINKDQMKSEMFRSTGSRCRVVFGRFYILSSRYPTSPSMGSVLYEIAVRSLARSTGRSLGVHERVIARSLG